MTGAASGGVKALLRIEGACVLLAASLAYLKFGLGWKTFAIFFFVPDISFLGYLAGPVVGAISYNAAHSYAGAVMALLAGVWLSNPILVGVALIWSAHLGFDRALGYGLKYSSGFGITHLGLIGRARQQA
ncbi:MAG: DUF4260 domain-containing protein [Holophagaceae bacterium]|nr:DUF4260 domain-containing protein [Holophagaceae bacterium]